MMLKKYGVLVFFGLTFVCAWTLWGLAHPEVQRQFGLKLSPELLLLAGTFVPSALALALSSKHGGAKKLISALFRWRIHGLWYAFAVLGPPILMFASTASHVALGGAWPDYPDADRWPLVALNLLAVLFLGGPLGEELGWRGYALPRLSSQFGLVGAGALVGLVWAVWHLPLFMLPNSPQGDLSFWLFALQAIALSLIMAVLWQEADQSIILPVLMHASVNSFSGPLRILPRDAGSTSPYIFSVALGWALAAVLIFAFARRGARKRTKAPSAPRQTGAK
jgi:membrane protease YdiL (CAAX protease family)